MLQLDFVSDLGVGGFGSVFLMRTPARKPIALKVVQRGKIRSESQRAHIRSEKQLMESLRHPFIVRL